MAKHSLWPFIPSSYSPGVVSSLSQQTRHAQLDLRYLWPPPHLTLAPHSPLLGHKLHVTYVIQSFKSHLPVLGA